MPRVDAYSCEPFRAWNRLEPRSRKEDFEEVLRAAVHDPLWMLTRQWQFGEFEGEDTGSAIFSKVKIQSTKLARYKSATEPKEIYSDHIPAEVKVESELPVIDYLTRTESAQYFLRLLGVSMQTAPAIAGYSEEAYLKVLRDNFKLPKPDNVGNTDSNDVTMRKLSVLVNEPLNRFLSAFGDRFFDGYSLYVQADSNPAGLRNLLIQDPSHSPRLDTTIGQYADWFLKKYKPAHNSSGKGAWIPEQLEYQFAFALPQKSTDNTVLVAEEYYSGDLEWYSVDVSGNDQPVDGLSGSSTTEEQDLVSEKIISVIPAPAMFAGMPHARWWQFENGNVDLGNIDADATDISKLIVSEFALVYGNDWLLIPYPLEVGTLTEVKGIIVTDVFGQKTVVRPVGQGQTDDWTSWGMFNLSVRNEENNKKVQADTRLFIPPCIVKNQESEPLEQIHFLRDEMANMVWAIETRLNSKTGNSMEGHSHITHLKAAQETIEPPAGAIPPDESAMFKYTLENTVPENWIPFIPVQIPGQHRAIRLQRASMPRWFRNEYAAVRPATDLLRLGINDDNSILKPFYVNEEEVPREGVKVSTSRQRTRWYNGSIIHWTGKRKNLGRGEGSSGLQFDHLEPIPKNKK